MSDSRASQIATSSIPENYYGVKGWLLFFVISMTILSPLYNVYELIQISALGSSSELEVVSGIIFFAIIISEIIAIVSTVHIFKKNPKGIKLAKAYLLFWIAVSFLLLIVPLIGFVSIIRNSIVAFIWLKYFNKSKRVKATFNF